MASTNNAFTILPPELFDMIIEYLIDKPSDVLSLALSCHSLKVLLIPSVQNKLEYRHIATPLNSYCLWDHIRRSPELACQVRRLDITGDIPSLRLPPDHRCVYQLITLCRPRLLCITAAVSGCQRIIRAMRRFFSIGWWARRVLLTERNDIWLSLDDFRSLVTGLVEIHPPQVSPEASPIRFANLNNLNISLFYDWDTPHPIAHDTVRSLRRLLSGCPILQSLSINNYPFEPDSDASFDIFFETAHCPHLRELSLSGILFCLDALAQFLERHPSVEEFGLFKCQGISFPPSKCFRNLVKLRGSFSGIYFVVSSKAPIKEVSLCTYPGCGPPYFDIGIDALVGKLKSLERTLQVVKIGHEGCVGGGDHTGMIRRGIGRELPNVRVEMWCAIQRE
ncbi:hypothetical protein JAAARDRAFT_188845 [Jaapia argillacea MUCL 33604]|uniref:F-box domain-containing protein n=1 Tax=Jaapia argillacea MUCL 33604 TaxID=933084 RepID=A0A067QAQ9_9AGAM|nr:hypothetical protein JAAARDRAFT_188845 [Jaapia argillacea MUCL 33604]